VLGQFTYARSSLLEKTKKQWCLTAFRCTLYLVVLVSAIDRSHWGNCWSSRQQQFNPIWHFSHQSVLQTTLSSLHCQHRTLMVGISDRLLVRESSNREKQNSSKKQKPLSVIPKNMPNEEHFKSHCSSPTLDLTLDVVAKVVQIG